MRLDHFLRIGPSGKKDKEERKKEIDSPQPNDFALRIPV